MKKEKEAVLGKWRTASFMLIEQIKKRYFMQ